jgi:two-component system, NarL family, invasion response regulator UvrY
VASPVRVVVVDDQAAFRRAVAAMVAVTEGFRLVGEAGSGEEVVKLLGGVEADLVLLDVNMPGWGGVATARRLAIDHPAVAVVLLSTYEADSLPDAIVRSNITYRDKQGLGPEELVQLWGAEAARRGLPNRGDAP